MEYLCNAGACVQRCVYRNEWHVQYMCNMSAVVGDCAFKCMSTICEEILLYKCGGWKINHAHEMYILGSLL